MTEALRQVKAALGPDAVILETSEAAGELTVTAAMERADAPAETELAVEVRRLAQVVRALIAERRNDEGAAALPELRTLQASLAAQGVDGGLAAALVQATALHLGAGRPLVDALGEALAPGVVATDGAAVRVFLGPPGDGKTTTVAKLAARARQAGARVLLVGTDTYRVGAGVELAVYGRALGVEVTHAPDPAALVAVLGAVAPGTRVLIDTAGAAPGQAGALAELAALVRAAGPGAGRTLVASATAGHRAAAAVCAAYAPLRPDRCVLTKCDAAPAGPLLTLAWRHGLHVSHVAVGRRIPDDLESATPAGLAARLLAA
ncbi:MAG: hypothetical protein U0807_00725 [Candidatus Binatia bacterium]